MTDWGRSGRTDEFTIVRVDPFTLEEFGGPVDFEPKDCSITWDWESDNLYTARIGFAGRYDGGRDFMLRVKVRTECDGAVDERELATLFVDSFDTDASHGLEKTSCSCYSVLWRYDQDVLVSDFSRHGDPNPALADKTVDAIRFLVESRGGHLVVGDGVAGCKQYFGNDILFEFNTSILEVMQTIAGWIGCRIGCDGHGNVTLDVDLDAESRGVAYTFEDGRNSVYLDGSKWGEDRSDAINRVLYYYSPSDEEKVPARALVDLPEWYRGSYARIGRYVPEVVRYDDEISEADLQSLAVQYLYERAGLVRYFEIEHAGIPGLSVGDVVVYEDAHNYASPVKATCRVTQMSLGSFTPGAMCSTKLTDIDVITEVTA